MKKKLVLLFIFTISFYFVQGMTRAQLKKTLTVMKKQCMPKHGVTNEKVGNIEQGVFPEDHNVMCYIACIYKTVQVSRPLNYFVSWVNHSKLKTYKAALKNDRLDKDLVLKQIDVLYPAEIREESKKSALKCIPTQYKFEDTCEGIFNAVKCLYEENPSNFIFP